MGVRCLLLRNWSCRMAAAAILLAAVAALLVPSFQASNCGGNAAALSAVKHYSLLVRLAAAEYSNGEFTIARATPRQREELAGIANGVWTPETRFLVFPAPCRLRSSEPPRLIIVCDRPYRNVPRRFFGSAPPTHAAAYSDGSCRLISVAEFAAIDRKSLVPLGELLADLAP